MADDWINSKKRYILYTIICFAYLSNGIDLALVGPAVKDLAALMKTDEEKVLFGFSIRSFANGISSLIACYTLSKFSRQLFYSFSIFAYGLSTVLLPYLTNINQYLFLSAVFGFSNAYIDIATNLFVLELFQNYHLNFHVQVVHFSLAIGQTLGPLILGPFLAASIKDNKTLINQNVTLNEFLMNNSSLLMNFNETHLEHNEIALKTNIFIPFTLGGILFIICSVAMFLCWLIEPYKPPKRSIDGKDIELAKINKSKDEVLIPNQKFYILFGFLVQWLNAFESTMEYMFNYFISIYLANYLKVEGVYNTNLIALIGISYVTGRALNVAISGLKISATKMLYLNIILLLTGSIIIAYFIKPFNENNITIIGIAMVLIGLGLSSSLPNTYVFIEKRINITSTMNSLMITTSTALFCIESYRMSFVINSNPEKFKFINLYYIIAFAISFVLLHSTDLIKKSFLRNQKKT